MLNLQGCLLKKRSSEVFCGFEKNTSTKEKKNTTECGLNEFSP